MSRPLLNHPILTFLRDELIPILLTLGLMAVAHPARAAEETLLPPMKLLLEPEGDRAYSYRQFTREKHIKLMVYGFKDQNPGDLIPKGRRKLSSFFDQHLKSLKRDYLGQDGTQKFTFVTGDDSFTSTPINRGIQGDVAKMVGITIPVGKFTVGGGYTWGEENPALMLKTTEGLMAGASYDSGKMGFQLSYLTSGQEIAGIEMGGEDVRYNSLMFGTSFRVNDRIGITATAQWRNDNDPLTTGRSQGIFTVGTRWKF
jgi:hypothetical protein